MNDDPSKPASPWKSRLLSGAVGALLVSVLVVAALLTSGGMSISFPRTARESSPSAAVAPSSMSSPLPPVPTANAAATQAPTSTATVVACDLARTVPIVQRSTVQVVTANGTGTAFHVGNGEFVTNAHVVEGESQAQLRSDSVSVSASVVGLDFLNDIAVLHADMREPGLTWGDSRQITAGRPIHVMGYPRGVSGPANLTSGVVSGTSGGYIRTDAAINPGNSGGPAFDDCGRVVAVVVAKYSALEGAGLTIPENIARPSIERARANPPKTACDAPSLNVVAASTATFMPLQNVVDGQRLTIKLSVAQTSGARLDVGLSLVDANRQTVPGFAWERSVVRTIDVRLPSQARYLKVDNTHSLLTPKTVEIVACTFR